MRQRTILTLVTTFALVSTAAPAETRQTEQITENTLRLSGGQAAPAARAIDLAWLTGLWVGEGMGGVVQEVWAPPAGGSMMGLFKLIGEGGQGETSFTEHMSILEVGETLEVRLKHFNHDLTGWEEKNDFVTFPLVRLDEDAAYFRGLTYRKTGPSELTVYLAMKTRDGTREVKFVFEAVPSS